MYTDIVGSTWLNRTLGDDRARDLMHAHDAIVRSAVRAHSGKELQPTGDGFKLVFRTATDAVRATVDMQSALADRALAAAGPRLDIRVGIHFGTPLEEGEDVYGEAVILAARVLARAGGGQILVTGDVRGAADTPELEYVDRGRYHLKGFDQSIRLFEVLWHGKPRPTVPDAEPIELPRSWSGTSFVGRIEELRKLEDCLDVAEAGQSRIALLSGEAGIGKSRLALEFVRAVSERIGVTASTRCFPGLGGPLQPIVDLLRDLRSSQPALSLPVEVTADLAPLARLAPDLGRWLGTSLEDAAFALPEQEQMRLHAALVRLLLHVASDRTFVVILDDVQWADEPTLDVLRLLGRRLAPGLGEENARLLLLALEREEGPGGPQGLSETLAELERDRILVRVPLAALQTDELRQLLSDLCSRHPGAAFTSFVMKRSGGNPYFAEEIAKDTIERSAVHPADPRWQPSREDERIVPPGIATILAQRIARLSKSSLDFLQTASLLGRRFALSPLLRVCAIDESDGIRAIDEGYVAGLLFEEPNSTDYSFHHSLVADVLSASVRPAQRRARHASLAEALEQDYGESADEHASEIAHHLLGAGDRAPAERVLHYTALAGDRASALHAFAEADRWYAAALEAFEELPRGTSLDRAELAAKRALSLGRTGDLEAGRALADSAIRTFARARRVDRIASTCEAIASCLVLHARHRDALPYLERALKVLPKDAHALRGRTLWQYATALDLTGRSEEMRTTAKEILGVSKKLRSRELRERALLIERNWHANHTTDVGRARTLTRRVLGSAEKRSDLWDQTLLWESLGLFELSLARIDRALDALDRSLTLATNSGALAKIIDARGLRALCFCHRGEFQRVDEEWEQAAALMGRIPGSIHMGQFLWAKARVDLWLGRPVQSAPSPRKTYPGLSQLETAVLAVAGLVASESGDPSARGLLDAAGAQHPVDGVGLNWMLAAQFLAAAWVNLGEAEEAMRWYPGLQPYRRVLSLTFPALELARISSLAGAWQQSAVHFATARELAKREGLRPHDAIARYEQARSWLAQGRPALRARAERALDEAQEALGALGMQGALQRLANLPPCDTIA